MEKETLNSCIMLAANLDVPVDLSCIFDDADLKDTGIELDSHITLLYAQGKKLPREELRDDIITILGSSWEDFFNEYIKSEELVPVLDLFDLGNFGNDSDYVVLKLKKSCPLFDLLSVVNKGLSMKYDVVSDFKDYTPHLTLAELNPGSAKKYMNSKRLDLILNDSFVGFEDLLVSYGTDNEIDRKQYFLTSEKCVDRYFRLEGLKKAHKELMDV